MTMRQVRSPLVALAASLAVSSAAAAQTPAANATAPAATAEEAKALEDRVVALMQAHRCGAAVEEARKGGNEILAQQVSDVCGVKPGTSGKPRSGRGGGGGSGGGGGGGAPPRG